jgi:hypothetical protein
MRIDRPKDAIARDMLESASKIWGVEHAESLRAEIEGSAGHLSRVGKYVLPLDGDEPDFLIAPLFDGEAV